MQKTKAVIDTNTVVSGMFWGGAARDCLVALAKRKFQIAISGKIAAEYRRIAEDVAIKTGRQPMQCLQWIEAAAEWVEPMPIGELSRDSDDNIFVGCALAAGAKFVVTRDNDLLELGKSRRKTASYRNPKPFGIEIVTAREFLRKISLR